MLLKENVIFGNNVVEIYGKSIEDIKQTALSSKLYDKDSNESNIFWEKDEWLIYTFNDQTQRG